MSNYNGARRQRVKSVLDQRKLKLYGTKIEGAKGAPTLSYYITEAGMPRIDVYTNVEGDRDNGLIRAAMDIQTGFQLLEYLDVALNSPDPYRRTIDNTNSFVGGKRLEKPAVVSKTIVGRGEDGLVYISVIARDRPKAKFVWRPDFMHPVSDQDGQPADKAEGNTIAARAWRAIVSGLLIHVAANTWVEPKKPDGNGGGYNNNNGGGGYNNQGGQGGGQGGNGGGNGGGQGGGGFQDDIPF